MPYKKGLLARAPFAIHFRQQVAAATLLTSGVLFTNQAGGSAVGGGEQYEVIAVEGFWDVVSTSGTVDLRNVPAATAITGGASILTATLNLAATARAVQKGALVTAKITRTILPGNALSIVLGGTLTGLVGACITVWLQPLLGIRGR